MKKNLVLNKNDKELVNLSYVSNRFQRWGIINEIIKKIENCNIQTILNEHELFLIIDEAVTNAMEHGNRWDPKKYINVMISTNDKYLYLEIEDEGSGFDTRCVSSLKKNLNPRGRGIAIIKTFCSLEWNKIGNKIKLKILLSNNYQEKYFERSIK